MNPDQKAQDLREFVKIYKPWGWLQTIENTCSIPHWDNKDYEKFSRGMLTDLPVAFREAITTYFKHKNPQYIINTLTPAPENMDTRFELNREDGKGSEGPGNGTWKLVWFLTGVVISLIVYSVLDSIEIQELKHKVNKLEYELKYNTVKK